MTSCWGPISLFTLSKSCCHVCLLVWNWEMYFCLTLTPAAYSLVLVTRSCLAAEPAALHVFLHPCFSSVPSQQSGGHQAGCQLHAGTTARKDRRHTANAVVYERGIYDQRLMAFIATVKAAIAASGRSCSTKHHVQLCLSAGRCAADDTTKDLYSHSPGSSLPSTQSQ